VFMTRRYTNTRLPLPLPYLQPWSWSHCADDEWHCRLFVDVYCADPPSVNHGVVEGLQLRDPVTALFTYGTVMKYSCVGGRRFDDGHTTCYIQCVLHGVWNYTQLTCQCKSTFTINCSDDFLQEAPVGASVAEKPRVSLYMLKSKLCVIIDSGVLALRTFLSLGVVRCGFNDCVGELRHWLCAVV